MPIGAFQREVLGLLAANRSPDSYVAGATLLHSTPGAPRFSQGIDLFHDEPPSVEASFSADATILRRSGFKVEPVGRLTTTFRRALVQRREQQTKIEWAVDSAFRFFPVERDADFGWRLNFWDAATNKVLALVGRQTVRDYLDCLYLHEQHLHFGALAWAAAGKDPGLSPEMIVDWAARGNRFRHEDLAEVRLEKPVDLRQAKRIWLLALADARDWIARLPPTEAGCLYLDARGLPVFLQPESPDFPNLTGHFGSLKGVS